MGGPYSHQHTDDFHFFLGWKRWGTIYIKIIIENRNGVDLGMALWWWWWWWWSSMW